MKEWTKPASTVIDRPPIPKSSCFRGDLRVYPPRLERAERNHIVYDPVNDLSYSLGRNELMVAQLFDGHRNLHDVQSVLKAQHRIQISEEKLQHFEKRLLTMEFLVEPGMTVQPRIRDPATGISYGPFKALLMIQIMRCQPMPYLDYLYRRFGWLCSPGFVVGGVVFIFLACILVGINLAVFSSDVATVYGNGVTWLLWHYPVVVFSIAIHELGHALACRAYKVRVTDLGIAVYLLMATGWARPLQHDWSALDRRQRMVTILMGPYASLLFAAVGTIVWRSSDQGDHWHTIGVVMVTSSVMGLIPTLLPIFNGDTYLAITEYFGIPRLRQRAFTFVKNALLKKQQEVVSPRRQALYWFTVLGTLLGWLIAWSMLLLLVSKIVNFSI